MKEIVVLSGKGGTGKTSLMGGLAGLVPNKVLADCDVDAANLHLLLQPDIQSESPFISGVKARVLENRCSGCRLCFELCRFGAVRMDDVAHIAASSCEGCGVCAAFCPENAVALDDNHCGYVYRSDTVYGRFIHARLFAGEENSGKLVSHVRRLSRQTAEKVKADFILVDGAPGIGCPVIASITNASLLVVVTEASQSGQHDLERLLDLADHFKVPAFVCVNRWDLHPAKSSQVENFCTARGITVLGRIPFDKAVVDSQLAGKPLIEYSDGPAALAMRQIWQRLIRKLRL